MTDEEFYNLLDRYRNGECTPEEENLIAHFFTKNLEKESIVERWDSEKLSAIKSEIKANIWKGLIHSSNRKKHTILWRSIAASVAVFVLIGLYVFVSNSSETSEITYLTKHAERGQKLTVTLSDGSVVKLNSGSSVTYPKQFTGKERLVKLDGEAFFEVSENKEKPFIVSTNQLQTTVLGTSFNVKAYQSDKEALVTVVTGKVAVTPNGNGSKVYLIPGQQAVYDIDNESMLSRSVELESFVGWKDGIIRFDDIALDEALRILERWYDVEIVLESPKLGECYINSLYKNESLENVLESMKFINGLAYDFQSAANKVVITGNQCN